MITRLVRWVRRRRPTGGETYVGNDGRPMTSDPTYGRIDPDIQRQVDEMQPTSLGQRVALENTLQERRNRRGDS